MPRTSQQIRREFIEFFTARGHAAVASSSLLPADDPTLLFANAGMNQFKDVFLGAGSRPYTRAVDTQKCIRAGGKHNDLEDVGHDTCHHTFFEMLGNWSFGDYFKPEAIGWAWELLTDVWSLPKDRLWATVFGGDGPAGMDADAEAEGVWRSETDLPAGRIVHGTMKDNFWEMGDTGPCGPCTEIHIDLGAGACDGSRHAGSACAINLAGCGRFVELWNLVFIQFNRGAGGTLQPLPARHVDTGMGFERICAVLQGVADNYATDVFAPLMGALAAMSGVGYGDSPETDVALRVVADHARAVSFAIADGVLPSNEGRGYVVRRILRRAARFGRKIGRHEPFLHTLVPVLVEQMGGVFPEIAARAETAAQTIRDEEESFNRTLDRGLEIFARAAARADGRIGGEVAFDLYATYGFPVDLTRLMAAERGLTVDMAGYEAEMARHRELSSVKKSLFPEGGWPVRKTTPKYEEWSKEVPTDVLATLLLRANQEGGLQVASESVLSEGDQGIVLLRKTPFYAEAGGQVGDTGTIRQGDAEFRVTNTRIEKPAYGVTYHCHIGHVVRGTIKPRIPAVMVTRPDSEKPFPEPGYPGVAIAIVDTERRADTMRNHTATHLLNWALRRVLGEGVDQAGSVVEPSRLRFDFTHGAAVGDEQLAEAERLVNERVLADEPVSAKSMPLAEAREVPGVRAVFGEKYPDPVRVVRTGRGKGASAEFCGGTHVKRTSRIGLFKIVSEESVAKGVRRIVAVTGREAVRHVQAVASAARAAAGALRVPVAQLPERIAAMQAEIKQLRKQRAADGAGAGLDRIVAGAEDIGGVKVMIGELDADTPEAMRSAVDQLRQKAGGPAAVLVGSRSGGRVCLIAGLSEDVVTSASVRAGDWVKAAAAVVGGSGGGKATLAQAGGKDAAKLPQALDAGRAWIGEKLG